MIRTRILNYREPTKKTEYEIIRFWKKYAKRLSDAMTKGITIDDDKLGFATWTEEDIEILTKLIEKSYKELNVKFLKQTRGIKFEKKKNDIQTVSLEKIKDNKKIYEAFVEKRDEHIRYFKEFPKYVKGRTQKHIDKIVEHLEHSKKSVTFDAHALATELNFMQGMCRRHSNFIARDQVGKFTGAINEAQAKFVGATEYIWRTSKDNRVRHSHAEREGKIFRYDTPPPGGNPQEDYRCRCRAQAIIKIEGVDE